MPLAKRKFELPIGGTVTPEDCRQRLPRLLQNADSIRFRPGIYADLALVIERPVTLIGLPGTVFYAAAPVDRATLVTRTNVDVRGIVFVGARNDRGSGAAIRHEGGLLSLSNCTFRDCQNSVLGANAPEASVWVRDCTFVENGAADGHAHGFYIADTFGALKVEHSLFLGTRTGHHLKSRARDTTITDCRFGDGISGTASFAIDAPNGGRVIIARNQFRKSRRDGHFVFISYGGEGARYEANELEVIDNQFDSGRRFTLAVRLRQTPSRLHLAGNRGTVTLWCGRKVAVGRFAVDLPVSLWCRAVSRSGLLPVWMTPT